MAIKLTPIDDTAEAGARASGGIKLSPVSKEEEFGTISAPEPEPIFKSPSMLEVAVPPIRALNTAGRVFQREEAGLAAPILRLLSRFDPDAKPDRALFEDMVEGAKSGFAGEERSEFGFRPVELGDVVRKGSKIIEKRTGADIPDELVEPLAAGTGLLGTFGMPSQWGLNALSKVTKAAKVLPGTNDFLNAFRAIRKEAGLTDKAAASLMETATAGNVPADVALYAFQNPKSLTAENASYEKVVDVSKDAAKKILQVRDANPSAFGVDENIPGDLAQNMIDSFETKIGDAGRKLGKLKKQFGKEVGRKTTINELEVGIKKLMKEKNFIDKKGNLLDVYKDNPVANYLDAIRTKIREFGKNRFGVLDLNDIEGLKDFVSRKAYDGARPDAGGIMRPDPEIERLGRLSYAHIRRSLEGKYPAELLEAYDAYSELAHARGRMSLKFGGKEKLAGFLRNLDRKKAEQMGAYQELLELIPNGDTYALQIDDFLDRKAESLESVFPWLGKARGRNQVEIASELEDLLRKDFFSRDFDAAQKVYLEKLGKELGINLTKAYLDMYAARTFKKNRGFKDNIILGTIKKMREGANLGKVAAREPIIQRKGSQLLEKFTGSPEEE